MVLSEIMQRFISQRPVAVMVRTVLERQLDANFFDSVFDETAQEQFTRELTLSTCAKLVSQVTLGRAPSVHAAFVKDRETIPVSIGALYEKLQHVEPVVCEELVARCAAGLKDVVRNLDQRDQPIPGYRLRIADGNVLAGSEHRLKELRGSAAAAMPGKSLVVYDYATDLISALVVCEDGDASERRLMPQLLPKLRAGDLIMADRNFCTAVFLQGLVDHQCAFLIRHHEGLLLSREGKSKPRGRCSTGKVYEQQVRLKCGLVCRAITIVRDKPLKDGSLEVVLLTNLPEERAGARCLAELYLQRWTIEEAFRQLTQYLSCEVRTLGYPKAALFAFTLAVLAYNTYACIKAALATVPGCSRDEWSTFYLAWEVKTSFDGLLIAVPAEEWRAFAAMTPEELATFMRQMAQEVTPARYATHKRGPKTTVQRKKVRSYHESTAKLLQRRKQQKTHTVT